jgi:type IV secretion system protein VirB6
MIGVCPAVPPSAGFITSMTGFVDCQAQVLGSGAWQALAAPEQQVIADQRNRDCQEACEHDCKRRPGRSITVRDGTIAFVKIGAVFALATSWPARSSRCVRLPSEPTTPACGPISETSWPAYRTLVYDLVTDGPSQLVSEIGPQAGVVGSDGSLTQRLDLADQALAQLAILGVGNPPPNADAQVPPPPFGGFDAFALGGSRILFELTAIAGLAIVRIVTGLMLALGPFFIAFLMFDCTRSLFEGWVRVLAGTALAGIGVSVALGLELALLEPWLSNVLARRMAGEALPMVATELFVIACLFSMIVAAALYACVHVARAFRLAPLLRTIPVIAAERRTAGVDAVLAPASSREAVESERSRAAAVASVLVATTRRDHGAAVAVGPGAQRDSSRVPVLSPSNERTSVRVPVGRSFTRRPHARFSAVAARRDTGA